MLILKELRIEKGKTQQQVANDLGIVQQKYQQYESGKYQPDIDMLKKMSNYFNVSIDYLLGKSLQRNEVFKMQTLDLSDEEKALILSLRRHENGKALIKAVFLMIGELRSVDEILREKRA